MPDNSAVPERELTVRAVDRRRIAVAEWGPRLGRPVFLLHGLPGSRLLCPDVTVTHDLDVRLVTFDRPGYGASDPAPGHSVADGAADLEAIADTLGLDRFAVVGWSGGAPYALAAGERLGARVARIAVVAGDAPIATHPELLERLPGPVRDRIARLQLDDAAAMAELEERLAPIVADPASILPPDREDGSLPTTADGRLLARPGYRAAMTAHFREALRPGGAGYRDDWIATVRPWGFRLADVRQPVDVWWGDDDRLASRTDTEVIAADLPNATLRIVPGAGHSLASSHWREILEALLAR